MRPGGEGLDPNTKEHPDPSANADGDGLPADGGEHPDPKAGMHSEHPAGAADDIGDIDPDEILPPGGDGEGDLSASGTTDSELGDIFEALKKEIPADLLEQLPEGALEVVQNYLTEATEDARKKLQAFLTKRTQERSTEFEELRHENDQLRANALTQPEAVFVNQLVEWNDQILRDPVATIPKIIRKLVADGRLSKEKAAQFMGGDEESLFPDGAPPEDKPLTMRDLKALREEDAKERRAREEQQRRQGDAREAGRQAINEAVRWPGFAEKNPKTGKVHFTELGMKVIESVRRREFTGPNAVRNAYKAYRAEQMEQENAALRNKTRKVTDAARGATGQPGGVQPTKTKPAGTGDPWDSVMKDVEENGLGV